MFCPMCGAPNEDDDEFCGNCGATLGTDLPAEGATARAADETTGTAAEAEAVPAAAGEIEIKAGEEKWPGPSQEVAAPALLPAGEPQPGFAGGCTATWMPNLLRMSRAAFRPAPMARITVAAPVTMSPPAQTWSREVFPVSAFATMFP